jgi:hypothetical protein
MVGLQGMFNARWRLTSSRSLRRGINCDGEPVSGGIDAHSPGSRTLIPRSRATWMACSESMIVP